MKKEKAITLISLVVTIIILLILAGITIATLKQSNLFGNAKDAKQKWEFAEQEEENKIARYANDINSYINGIRTDPTENLEDKGYLNFKEANTCGFITSKGTIQNSSLGLIPSVYETVTGDEIVTGGYSLKCTIEKEIETTFNSSDNFEISTEISLDNRVTSYMGGILITLYNKQNNEYNKFSSICVNDAWGGDNAIQFDTKIKNVSISSGGSSNTMYNASGRYGIVGDGEKVYFYRDNILLGSQDYTEGISVYKIKIEFFGYRSGEEAPPMILKDLYIGQPKFYAFLIED